MINVGVNFIVNIFATMWSFQYENGRTNKAHVAMTLLRSKKGIMEHGK